MNFLHKANIASRVFKSLVFGQVPNYAIVYVDGRCNMHCGFCIHAAMDARNSSTISPEDWGRIFKRADSLLHLTVTGGEPFLRKDFVDIIGNIINSCNVPRISIKSNGFYIKRIKENIRIIKKLPRAKGFASISYPGENKAKRFSKNSKKKINLPREIEKDLEKLTVTSS